jgi:hypothetical protein
MNFNSPLLLVAMLLVSTTMFSQRNPMRFGRIDKADLEMQYYEADSAANALILGDFGNLRIIWNSTNNNFEYQFTRHLRIKVFKTPGFDYGNFKLPLYKGDFSEERAAKISATSYYLEDNKVEKTELSRRDIFNEEVNARYNSTNFSVPGLREGCVFEVEYTIISDFYRHLPKWEFQHDIPAVFSEFRIGYPEYFNYSRQIRGFLDMTEHKTSDSPEAITIITTQRGDMNRPMNETHRINYRQDNELFRIENIPAFRREPYMDHPVNYVSHVEYELNSVNFPHAPITDFTSSWQQINQNLMNSVWFGEQLKRSGLIKDEAKAIMDAFSDPRERMVAAYALIQEKMFWNNMHSIYISNTLRQAWDKKSGNAADINMMLVLLLRELELDSDPVILSTRNFGKVFEWQTTLIKFNYVIAHVQLGDEVYLLDATEKNKPWHLLPERVVNGSGRLISNSIPKTGWVNLENTPLTTINETSTLMIKPNGSWDAIVMQQLDNYAAFNLLNTAKEYDTEEELIAAFEAKKPGVAISELTITRPDDPTQPVQKRIRMSGGEQDDIEKELIYLNPNIYSRIESNPFRLPERLFPVNFTYPRKETYTYRIAIPFGYVVEELPETMAIALEDRSCFFSYRVMTAGQQVQIIIDIEVNKPFFSFEEYPHLREYFAHLVEKQAEMIVMRKSAE